MVKDRIQQQLMGRILQSRRILAHLYMAGHYINRLNNQMVVPHLLHLRGKGKINSTSFAAQDHVIPYFYFRCFSEVIFMVLSK